MSRVTNIYQFINKANQIYNFFYDYSKVNYISTKTKVKIICPIHGEFEQTPYRHLLGKTGCRKCAGNATITKEDIIEFCKDKSFKCLNSEELVNSQKNNLWFKCDIDEHEWKTSFSSIRHGSGCPKCAQDKRSKLQTKNQEQFILEAKEVHRDKYDYSEVEYINARTKVKIWCKKCKEFFWQIPNNHLRGDRCSFCTGKIKNTYIIIKEFKEIHGNTYEYKKTEYIDYNTPLKIWCKKCKKYFYQLYYNHKKGCGCPNCKGNLKITSEEIIFLCKEKNILCSNSQEYKNLPILFHKLNI